MESLPQSIKISLLSPIESFCGQSVPSLSIIILHSLQTSIFGILDNYGNEKITNHILAT